MRAYCVANKCCKYKSSTEYCTYAGPGCAQEPILTDEIVHSIGILKDSPMVIVKQVELTDECIERIAKAVVKKLKRGREDECTD